MSALTGERHRWHEHQPQRGTNLVPHGCTGVPAWRAGGWRGGSAASAALSTAGLPDRSGTPRGPGNSGRSTVTSGPGLVPDQVRLLSTTGETDPVANPPVARRSTSAAVDTDSGPYPGRVAGALRDAPETATAYWSAQLRIRPPAVFQIIGHRHRLFQAADAHSKVAVSKRLTGFWLVPELVRAAALRSTIPVPPLRTRPRSQVRVTSPRRT